MYSWSAQLKNSGTEGGKIQKVQKNCGGSFIKRGGAVFLTVEEEMRLAQEGIRGRVGRCRRRYEGISETISYVSFVLEQLLMETESKGGIASPQEGTHRFIRAIIRSGAVHHVTELGGGSRLFIKLNSATVSLKRKDVKPVIPSRCLRKSSNYGFCTSRRVPEEREIRKRGDPQKGKERKVCGRKIGSSPQKNGGIFLSGRSLAERWVKSEWGLDRGEEHPPQLQWKKKAKLAGGFV